MTYEEMKNLPIEEQKQLFNRLKKVRGVAKTANFACVYGAGGSKIAKTAKISEKEGYKLHKIYWEKNIAVKKTANACIVKEVPYRAIVKIQEPTGEFDKEGNPITVVKYQDTVKNQKWLYNPISGFWLFLKAEKDRFSTLNQSSGVFVVDSWIYQVRKQLKSLGIKLCLQYHDELLLYCKKEHVLIVKQILRESMQIVNTNLKLNVEIKISDDEGSCYADCH